MSSVEIMTGLFETQQVSLASFNRKDYAPAFEAFYMQVFSYVMTLTSNRDDAMEITQETFFRAFNKAREFRQESDEVTWLCAIAKNCFYDEKRRQSKTAPIPEEIPDPGKEIEQAAADRDSSFRIHVALHALEEPYRISERFSERPKTGPGSHITVPD